MLHSFAGMASYTRATQQFAPDHAHVHLWSAAARSRPACPGAPAPTLAQVWITTVLKKMRHGNSFNRRALQQLVAMHCPRKGLAFEAARGDAFDDPIAIVQE